MLYPGRSAEPLSAIRAAPEAGCVRLRLLPGESVVAFANEIPHCLTQFTLGRRLGQPRIEIAFIVPPEAQG